MIEPDGDDIQLILTMYSDLAALECFFQVMSRILQALWF